MRKLSSVFVVVLALMVAFSFSFYSGQVFAEGTTQEDINAQPVSTDVQDQGTGEQEEVEVTPVQEGTDEEGTDEEATEEEATEEAGEEEGEQEEIDEEASEEEGKEEVDEEDKGEGEGKGKGKGKGNENGNVEGNGKNKEWKEIKDELEAKKDKVEEQKDALEEQKDELEEQYEEAKEAGDTELAEQLRAQVEELKAQMDALKQEMKQIKSQMKEVVRNKYTREELEQLQKIKEELEAGNADIKVLPVESILAKGVDVKFDTPPVIKEGRTLIPVRAISEGFGAEVTWNAKEKKVIIVKGEVEIILQIDVKVAVVNGEEVEIDVPSSIMNNRTVVPLRFIIENLGLKIEWDGETDTIEIEDDVAEEGNVEETGAEEGGTEETGTEEPATEELGEEEAGESETEDESDETSTGTEEEAVAGDEASTDETVEQ